MLCGIFQSCLRISHSQDRVFYHGVVAVGAHIVHTDELRLAAIRCCGATIEDHFVLALWQPQTGLPDTRKVWVDQCEQDVIDFDDR